MDGQQAEADNDRPLSGINWYIVRWVDRSYLGGMKCLEGVLPGENREEDGAYEVNE